LSKRSQIAKECKEINVEMRHHRVEEDAPQQDSKHQPERRSSKERLGPQTSATEYADKENTSEAGRVGKELVQSRFSAFSSPVLVEGPRLAGGAQRAGQ